MKKTIGDIIENPYENKKTGLSAINVAADKNFFKFYLKNGEVYHISFGSKKGAQCLNEIASREIISYNSILSTEEIIETLKDMNKFVSYEDSVPYQSSDSQKIKDTTKTSISQIGPLGSKITEKYTTEKWITSDSPSKNEFLNEVKLKKRLNILRPEYFL